MTMPEFRATLPCEAKAPKRALSRAFSDLKISKAIFANSKGISAPSPESIIGEVAKWGGKGGVDHAC